MSATAVFAPLADPLAVARRVFAQVIAPPPPADLNAWAEANVRFGAESPFPGPYDRSRFPYFGRILEVLGPEHPARIVAFVKSAQLGGTVVAQIFVGGCLEIDPGPMLYTHPTDGNAVRWAKTKWKAMIRQVPSLRALFAVERSRDGQNSILYQERRDGRGHLIISGANSAAQLSMISVSRQVQDDLGKWELNNAGDPEDQADARSQAFEWAKIFKVGTPLLEHNCRITKAFKRSTQEHWHVPCPGCGVMQPLEWDNMLGCLDEADPAAAHFTCAACGVAIEHKHKAWMNERGQWVAHNPAGDVVGFYLWSAYSPLQSWQRIAEAWLSAKGDPAREQTFLNDVVGRAFKQAGESPPWEAIRDRAAEGEHRLGQIPPGALLLTIGVDCQVDRCEWHLKGFGRELKRWSIDYGVIAGHVSEDRARAELDALLKRTWPDPLGNFRTVDMLAIDGNYSKTDVMDWVRPHPQERVIVVRGVKGDQAAEMQVVKKEQLGRGNKVVRYGRRFWNVGVSPLKASLYKQLQKTDPQSRGYCSYPQGLEDDFFRQLCAERRAPVKRRDGFVEWHWVKDAGQANEVLDTEMYAEAAAIRLGWKRILDHRWDQLQAEREAPPAAPQLDLLDPAQALAGPTLPANGIRPGATATQEPGRRIGGAGRRLN